jgi:hypothetical protein
MKKILFPLFVFSICLIVFSFTLTSKKKKGVKYSVEGTVFEINPYCGGAAPSPEQENPKPHPKAGIKLLIRKGNFNDPQTPVIDSLVSDADGNFKIQLAPGTYSLIEPWKKEKYIVPQDRQYLHYDTACYRKMYHESDYTLVVKNKMKDVAITFQRHCQWQQPCAQYDGPLPPAANPGRGKIGE